MNLVAGISSAASAFTKASSLWVPLMLSKEYMWAVSLKFSFNRRWYSNATFLVLLSARLLPDIIVIINMCCILNVSFHYNINVVALFPFWID
jgi:hypothetical protein